MKRTRPRISNLVSKIYRRIDWDTFEMENIRSKIEKNVLFLAHNRFNRTEAQISDALKAGATNIFLHIDPTQDNQLNKLWDKLVLELVGQKKIKIWIRDKNVGSKDSVLDSISWAFGHVDSLLIVEDDLDLHPEFFEWMWAALDQYKGESNIGGVTGFNPWSSRNSNFNHLYFSKVPITWGWGTWKDRWGIFEKLETKRDLSAIREGLNSNKTFSSQETKFWQRRIDETETNFKHIWDYPFALYNALNNQVFIYSPIQLVRNVGFSDKLGTVQVRERRLLRCEISKRSPFREASTLSKDLSKVIMRDFHRVKFYWPINEILRSKLGNFLKVIQNVELRNSKQIEIVISQASIDAYRSEFIQEILDSEIFNFKIMTGSSFFDPSVKTRIRSKYNKLENYYFIGRKVLFQKGYELEKIQARIYICELNPRIISNWLILILRRIFGRPSVLWGHVNGRHADSRISDLLREFQLAVAGRNLIVYTKQEEILAKKKYKLKNVSIAYNALYKEKDLKSCFNRKSNSFAYIGRLSRDKNVDKIIKAFSMAQPNLEPDTKLYIVGDGPVLKSLTKLASDLGIAENVAFLGHVSDQSQLMEIYAELIATVNGGFVGLTVIQSLGFGVPVIYPDREDVAHAPEHSLLHVGNSISYGGDSSNLADCLVEFQSKSRISLQKANEISLEIAEFHNIEKMAGGILLICETLMRNNDQNL